MVGTVGLCEVHGKRDTSCPCELVPVLLVVEVLAVLRRERRVSVRLEPRWRDRFHAVHSTIVVPYNNQLSGPPPPTPSP